MSLEKYLSFWDTKLNTILVSKINFFLGTIKYINILKYFHMVLWKNHLENVNFLNIYKRTNIWYTTVADWDFTYFFSTYENYFQSTLHYLWI